MVDLYEPSLMFAVPRLAIVYGLLISPWGPLNVDKSSSGITPLEASPKMVGPTFVKSPFKVKRYQRIGEQPKVISPFRQKPKFGKKKIAETEYSVLAESGCFPPNYSLN